VESKQAIELLPLWVSIDVEDSLELLSPQFEGLSDVRTFAVGQLRRAEDDEIMLFLLQLVQAIKFEASEGIGGGDSSLVQFLIERGVRNPILGNSLYWYLMVETEDKTYGKTFGKVVYRFLKVLIEVKRLRRRWNT
jgi:phosphatidylinositol 3-kinase